MLRRLADEDALPTQLYLSTNASNRKMFYTINRPRHKDGWKRWWELKISCNSGYLEQS